MSSSRVHVQGSSTESLCTCSCDVKLYRTPPWLHARVTAIISRDHTGTGHFSLLDGGDRDGDGDGDLKQNIRASMWCETTGPPVTHK